MPTILIADDDRELAHDITSTLREARYDTVTCHHASAAARMIETQKFTIAILDWVFLGEPIGGMDLIRLLRSRQPQCGIILLTSKTALMARMAVFDAEVDDYMPKPIFLPELTARVRALWRRLQHIPMQDTAQVFVVDQLALRPARHEILLEGRVLPLKPKEYDLLAYLMHHAGRVITRSELMDAVWRDNNADTLSNTVDVHIGRLRKHLGSAGHIIQTQHGIGYMLLKSDHDPAA